MTYRKTEKCGFFCQVSKIIRRLKWKAVKPVSMIRHDSYTAIRKHFAKEGRY